MKRKLKAYSDSELLTFYREEHLQEFLVELYGRYTALVYGVALKYLKSVEDAEDMVIQIWEELFAKLSEYDIKSFNSWLYICVRNRCLMELRNRSGIQTVVLDESFMEFSEDLNLVDREEDERNDKAVEECMEKLPAKQQICVRKFFIDEQSYKEIADLSGFSLKLVKSCIQNVKRNLKLCLEQKVVRL